MDGGRVPQRALFWVWLWLGIGTLGRAGYHVAVRDDLWGLAVGLYGTLASVFSRWPAGPGGCCARPGGPGSWTFAGGCGSPPTGPYEGRCGAPCSRPLSGC